MQGIVKTSNFSTSHYLLITNKSTMYDVVQIFKVKTENINISLIQIITRVVNISETHDCN